MYVTVCSCLCTFLFCYLMKHFGTLRSETMQWWGTKHYFEVSLWHEVSAFLSSVISKKRQLLLFQLTNYESLSLRHKRWTFTVYFTQARCQSNGRPFLFFYLSWAMTQDKTLGRHETPAWFRFLFATVKSKAAICRYQTSCTDCWLRQSSSGWQSLSHQAASIQFSKQKTNWN